MRIDVHSHLASVAFLEHLQGRGTLPTVVRDAGSCVVHCAPQFSTHCQQPIISVEARLRDMDAAGIDLTVLSPAPPGPARARRRPGRQLGGPDQRRAGRHHRGPAGPLGRVGEPRVR